ECIVQLRDARNSTQHAQSLPTLDRAEQVCESRRGICCFVREGSRIGHRFADRINRIRCPITKSPIMKLSRRQIIGGRLAGGSGAATMAIGFRPRSGGVATGGGGSQPLPTGSGALDLNTLSSRDAFQILNDTIRLNKRITFGGNPAAAAPNDPN